MRRMLVGLTILCSMIFTFSTTYFAEDNPLEKQGTFITNADERFIPLAFQKSLKEDVERNSSGVLSLQSVDTITDKVVEEKWSEVLEKETEYKSFKMLILYSESEDRVFLKTEDNQNISDKAIKNLKEHLNKSGKVKSNIQRCIKIYSDEYSFFLEEGLTPFTRKELMQDYYESMRTVLLTIGLFFGVPTVILMLSRLFLKVKESKVFLKVEYNRFFQAATVVLFSFS